MKLLEISISNFKSYKDKVALSMIAGPSKLKSSAYTENVEKLDTKLRVLKVMAVYGPNGSGKTNIFAALYAIQKLLTDNQLTAGDPIPYYDPFKFNTISRQLPCEFSLSFILKNGVRYYYEISFIDERIIHEELTFFPKGQASMLFKREIDESKDAVNDRIVLGNSVGRKIRQVFINKTGLGFFGENEPNKYITPVFQEFKEIDIINFIHPTEIRNRDKTTGLVQNDSLLLKQVNDLIRQSDLKINRITIDERDRSFFSRIEEISEELADKVYEKNKYEVKSWHDVYDAEGNKVAEDFLRIQQESQGTNALYSIAGRIFNAIRTGGIVLIDELDASLHPHLAMTILNIFFNPEINVSNAQLIFTAHDFSLLDNTVFRKDQISFSEKNEKGESELFSINDFDGVRESAAFEKWYRAGKFGALPVIGDLEQVIQ